MKEALCVLRLPVSMRGLHSGIIAAMCRGTRDVGLSCSAEIVRPLVLPDYRKVECFTTIELEKRRRHILAFADA